MTLQRMRLFPLPIIPNGTTEMGVKIMTRSKSAQTRAKNKYNRNHYDRINVIVPIGDREIFRAVAEMNGMSMNEYICRLIYRSISAKYPF